MSFSDKSVSDKSANWCQV